MTLSQGVTNWHPISDSIYEHSSPTLIEASAPMDDGSKSQECYYHLTQILFQQSKLDDGFVSSSKGYLRDIPRPIRISCLCHRRTHFFCYTVISVEKLKLSRVISQLSMSLTRTGPHFFSTWRVISGILICLGWGDFFGCWVFDFEFLMGIAYWDIPFDLNAQQCIGALAHTRQNSLLLVI